MGSRPLTPDEVNIGDILRLALPLATSVKAGVSQTRRRINWVVLLTNWQPVQEQVSEDDLVLMPPVLQGQMPDSDLAAQIDAISHRNAAGLLLFNDVSEELVERAVQQNLTLLVLPQGASVRETHRAIASLLVDRQTATNERGMQLYRRLSEMSREGRGLAAMTDFIANLTGKVVIVQDKRLEVQATSLPHNSDLDRQTLVQLLSKRDQLPAVLRNRKAAARARQSYWQQLLPIVNMGRLISPIISGDRARGYLSVVGPADQLDLLDCLAAEHGAAACALEMAKAKAVSEAKKALRGDFLEGLLAGTLPRREIERLSGRLDHDTEVPHAIIAFAWVGQGAPSLRRLETTVNWILSNHSRPALVHPSTDFVCIFHPLRGDEDMQTAHLLAHQIREQLAAEFPQAAVIGGISGPAAGLPDWPRVCDEAVQAMKLGQRLELNRVIEYGALGVYRLLSDLEELPSVREFTRKVIGPLADYDRQHRSSLVQTIDAFFKHHGNISKTAESLFIHRNTLLYRLDRIQELTGHDLNQSYMRLALHLALIFWQLQTSG